MKLARYLLLAVLLLAGPSFGRAEEPTPVAKPEQLGFSSVRLQRLTNTYQGYVDRGELPGAVLLIARGDKIAYLRAIGYQDREKKTPMKTDAIFRLASMTKPIASVAVMMLVEEGKIDLGAPVSKYIPEFADLKVGVEAIDPATGKPTLTLVPQKRPMIVHARKPSAAGTSAVIAVETIGPTPGIVISRRAVGSAFERRLISASSTAICASRAVKVSTSSFRVKLSEREGNEEAAQRQAEFLGRNAEGGANPWKLRRCLWYDPSMRTKVRSPMAAPKRPLPPALAQNLWRPGQSGNPSGQSGEYGEVVRLARALSVRAIERLGELLESADERVAAVACQAILDRAHGKPRPSREEQTTLEERIAAMTPEQRRERLIELTERARRTLEQDRRYAAIDDQGAQCPLEPELALDVGHRDLGLEPAAEVEVSISAEVGPGISAQSRPVPAVE